jgi:hypothetical protein
MVLFNDDLLHLRKLRLKKSAYACSVILHGTDFFKKLAVVYLINKLYVYL